MRNPNFIKRVPRSIEQLNADLSLDDVRLWWQAQYLLVMSGNKVLTTLDTTLPDLQGRIARWCDKNSMRCTQVHDGKIWL